MDLTIYPTASTFFHGGSQLFDAIKAEAAGCFAAEEARKQAMATAEEARRYQQEKRQLFLDAIGGLPAERSELQPVITGVTQRDGYRIEKVIFQSQPGMHVTGLLYVPDQLRAEQNAAVLFVCGHWGVAKAAPQYQRVCQELVRGGFVVFAMDPIGQGERQQYYLPENGCGRFSAGVPEHIHLGLQCTLTGSNLTRYYVWDMMRAVDYLSSLPYVDPQRIGVTGNSGGGTQTSYAMIADERLAAAVPCTFLNDRELYLACGQPHDHEQNLFGAIRDGIGYDDFLIAFAPRPALVGAARYDFFFLKGTDKCLASARRFYRLLGKEEDCAIAIADTPHTYAPALRKAAVNFFLQHLCALPPTHPGYADEELVVEPEEVTNCCRSGHVVAEFADERTVFDLNRDYLQQCRAERQTPTPAAVAEALGIADKLPLRETSTYRVEIAAPIDDHLHEFYGVIRKRVEFFAEDGIYLSGLYFQEKRTAGTRPPLCLLVHEDGLVGGEALHRRALDLIWAGNAVFICDVRGVGAGASTLINGYQRNDCCGTEFIFAYDYLMLGRSLPGLRAFDVLRAIDCLREMDGDYDLDRLSVHGIGLGALYALYAAALEPRITGGVLDGMLPSYQAIVDTEFYNMTCPERQVAHGILRRFDLPDLLQALQPRQFALINPLDIGSPQSQPVGGK